VDDEPPRFGVMAARQHGRAARVSSAARLAAPRSNVVVLTPTSSVAALRAGFVPQVHASAGG